MLLLHIKMCMTHHQGVMTECPQMSQHQLMQLIVQEHLFVCVFDRHRDTDQRCGSKAKQCQSSAAQGCLLLKKKCSGATHVGGGHGGACHLDIKVSQPQVEDRDPGGHHLCSTTSACDYVSDFMSLPLDWPQNCLSHFTSLPFVYYKRLPGRHQLDD